MLERIAGGWGFRVGPARLAYAAIIAALGASYWAVPGSRPAVLAIVTAVSVSMIVLRAALRNRLQRRMAWLLVGVASVLLGMGQLILLFGPHPQSWPALSPRMADVFYLSAYLPLVVGLLWLGQSERPERDAPLIMDAVAWSLAVSLVAWITLARPSVAGAQLTFGGKATVLAEWVAYVAVLAVSARMLWIRPLNLARGLLAAGTIVFVASDFVYGAVFLHIHRHLVGLAGFGYLCFSALCGAAALIPSTMSVESVARLRDQLGPGRLAVLATALLTAPTALFVEATSGPVTAGIAIAVISVAVGGLTLARLLLSVQDNHRRVRHNKALAAASRTLVMATTESEVVAAAATALATALPTAATSVGISHEVGDAGNAGAPVPAAPRIGMPAGAHGPGELSVPMRSAGREERAPGAGRRGGELPRQSMVFTAPATQLVELRSFLCLLAEQAGVALDRIDLTAQLQAEERQHYFRTLVQGSADVILISRHDRVDYATPSAQSMFGRDVRGEGFGQLVRRHGSDHNPARPADSGWSNAEDGVDGQVIRPDGRALTVVVHRRDLTADPTVTGIVSTLRDVTIERDLQDSLEYRASHDSLTGLVNAERFRQALRDLPSTVAGAGSAAHSGRAALFVDLDDFKMINDTYGHHVGDVVLRIVARRIEMCVRANDLVARLGGDEFAVLLTDLATSDRAREVAERIMAALAQPADVAGVGLDCQASIGLAYAADGQQRDTLLAEADTALYTAKAHGKGRCWQFRDRVNTPGPGGMAVVYGPDPTLAVDRWELRYEPVVELKSGRAIGFQTILHDPTGEEPDATSLRPMVAEGIVQATAAADRLLGQALTDAAALNTTSASAGGLFVSVHASVRQLRNPAFADTVRAQLTASGLASRLLVLQITESLGDDDTAWSFLDDLRGDGVRVAIDEFGAGLASLGYLRRPGLDIVKTDRSFLNGAPGVRARAVLQAVTWLSARLGLTHIAEGVHDTESRDLLLRLGCQLGQGPRYGSPMPIDEAIAWQQRPANRLAEGDR